MLHECYTIKRVFMCQLGEYQGCVFVGRVIFAHKKWKPLRLPFFLIKTALAVVGQDDVAIKITNTADGFALFVKAKFAD